MNKSAEPVWRDSQAVNILLTCIVRGCSAAGTFLFNIVLARLLSIDDFGQFSLCFSALVVLSMLARFGIDTSLLRFAGSAWFNEKPELFSGYCSLSLKIVFGFGAALSVLGGIVAYVASRFGYVDPLTAAWMLAALIPYALVFSLSSVLKSAGKPQLGAAFEAGTASLLAAALFWAAYLFGVEVTSRTGAIMVTVASVTVLLAVLIVLRKLKVPVSGGVPLTSDQQRTFFISSGELAMITVAQTLACWSGGFFLAGHGTDADIGGFAAALRVVSLTVLFRNVIIFVVNPKLAGLYESGNHVEFSNLARKSALQAGLLCSLPLLPMIFLPSWVMSIFGEEFVVYGSLLVPLAIAQLISTLTCIAPSALAMTGHEREVRRVSVSIGMISIAVTYILVRQYGATGAAIGASLYLASLAIVMMFVARRHLGLWALPGFRKGVEVSAN